MVSASAVLGNMYFDFGWWDFGFQAGYSDRSFAGNFDHRFIRYKKWHPYLDIQKHMMDTLAGVINVLVYIALIGALIGAFMSAGTIPYIICVGLKMISPGFSFRLL